MLSYIKKVTSDAKDQGASAVEYGLMVAAIAAVIVGLVFALGGVVSETFRGTGATMCAEGFTATDAVVPAECTGTGEFAPTT